MLVASAMITYSRLRRRSGGRLALPPAWVRRSVNPVRASISTSTDAMGTRGSIAASSSRSALASAGTSSAVSGGMMSSPSGPRRTSPFPPPRASWASRSDSAA